MKYHVNVWLSEREYSRAKQLAEQLDLPTFRVLVQGLRLLDVKHTLFPVFDRLQDLLSSGHRLSEQDGLWWLFDEDGNGVCSGTTLRELCVNLVMS